MKYIKDLFDCVVICSKVALVATLFAFPMIVYFAFVMKP